MEWDELRSRFDRLYGTQAPVDILTDQVIDSYQAELLKLYANSLKEIPSILICYVLLAMLISL